MTTAAFSSGAPQVAERRHRLAAVVPAWEEAATIAEVVRGLLRNGACCVFVVDPGSRDGTQALAAQAGAVVVPEPRRGYGQACLTGAAAAAGHELIAFLDGDGSCDPGELPALAGPCASADLALGRRRTWEPGALPWHARAGNALAVQVIRRRAGRGLHDLPPFKVIRADALAALHLRATGYGWTVELVARALAHPALAVQEVDSHFRLRRGGKSKVSGQIPASMRAGRAMLAEAGRSARRRGVLVLMAKGPRAGHSKTRLALEIGQEAAQRFWCACLRDAGPRWELAAAEAGLDVLAMTPSREDALAVRELSGLPALVQTQSGLGQALLEVSELAAPFTIAVSADVPALPKEVLPEAIERLQRFPAVLGPGPDGGYYLVGLKSGYPLQRRRQAFLQAPLGGAAVLAHTQAALGHPPLLPPHSDVDTRDDLDSLAVQLERYPATSPAVATWLDSWRRESERTG